MKLPGNRSSFGLKLALTAIIASCAGYFIAGTQDAEKEVLSSYDESIAADILQRQLGESGFAASDLTEEAEGIRVEDQLTEARNRLHDFMETYSGDQYAREIQTGTGLMASSGIWSAFGDWSINDIQHGLSLLTQSEEVDLCDSVITMVLLSRWAELDGKAAITYSIENIDLFHSSFSHQVLLDRWAKAEPEELAAWYGANQFAVQLKGIHPWQVNRMVFSQRAKNDLAGTLSSIDFGDPDGLSTARRLCAEITAFSGQKDELLTLIQGMETGAAKDHLLEAFVDYDILFGNDNSLENLQKLNNQDPEWIRQKQLKALAYRATRDPLWAISSAVELMPEGALRNQAVSDAFGVLAKDDSAQAELWLENNISLYDRDQLVEAAVNKLESSPPDIALDWIKKIQDDEKRLALLNEHYEDWSSYHQLGAQAWLEQQDAETQAAILGAD